MCERILEGRKRKTKNEEDEAMGFGDFGGYFESKKAKLVEQFKTTASSTDTKSQIFKGVAIFVNGLTNPNASELKKIMAEHGGIFHGYQMSSTTHLIASNLAYAKTKNLGSVPIVKASWITDSVEMKKLLDYKRYLLFSNQSAAQPKLNFPVLLDLKSSENSPESDSKQKCNTISKTESSNNKITKTASDPQFLEEFYNNSRLHLIATMGAEFKQLVGQLREKSDGKFVGKETLNLKNKSNCKKRSYSSVVMHIDMDCFFVSVGLRKRPELKGKPVVVTHARNANISSSRPGRSVEIAMNMERAPENIVEKISNLDSNSSMSEIACCSYEARKCGIKNGMFLGTAIKLCPSLKTIQYDFQDYKDVANTLYKTLSTYTLDIEAVSCDEMYVDVTKILNETGLTVHEFATHLRAEIFEKTGCPCSTGFGANKLQARLATKKAKPNGQFYLEVDDVESYFSGISLADLPGVGRATLNKLKTLGLQTCGDVQRAPLNVLQAELGPKVGETLLEQAKGIDRKPLSYNHERKSVSAEVNYGIRFKTLEETQNFLQSLSQEVFNRLNDLKMKAKCLTLKLMVRASDAPVETAKFLGHGICDSLSKSTTCNVPICDFKSVHKEVKLLFEKFNVPFVDLRGVGIQLSKLEKIGPVNTVMSNFLKKEQSSSSSSCSTSVVGVQKKNVRVVKEVKENNNNKTKRGRPGGVKNKNKVVPKVKPSPIMDRYLKNNETMLKNTSKINGIDMDVFKELPKEIQEEILNEYKLKTITEAVNVEPPKAQVSEPVKMKKSHFEGLSWEELKPILRCWMSSTEEPLKFDVELISQHFRQMAIDRKIENLKIVFNFLHRTFSKLGCGWHKAYFSIVDVTQQGMVARYGGTLKVERKFTCCGS